MQQYDGPGAAVEPPPPSDPAPPTSHRAATRHRRRTALVIVGLLLTALAGVGLAFGLSRLLLPDDGGPGAGPTPTAPSAGAGHDGSATGRPSAHPSPSDTAAARTKAVEALLGERSRAVLTRDRNRFMSTVDPEAADFAAGQGEVFDRLATLSFDEWSYTVTGDGPGLPAARAASLPPDSRIVRVRLTYRMAGTRSTFDREQYLTVVRRGGRWLLASDTDAAANGFDTQRDLWDLGPVRAVHGDSSLVLADTRGLSPTQLRRIADEADLAVRNVDDVWTGSWSRRPVIIVPRNQADMATLIDSNGDGLAQIAAVTTGSFESGVARGDRIVVNPAAWVTLGSLGRRVVLTHEMTHVATRATSVAAPPIWLSEGFADYVAYQATPVPTAIVASDLFRDVRDGKLPKRLPDDAAFDASRGDIAGAYEGAWLACRMIADRWSEKRLVRLYSSLTDSAGPGWPQEMTDVLGVGDNRLTREWMVYLRQKAAA